MTMPSMKARMVSVNRRSIGAVSRGTSGQSRRSLDPSTATAGRPKAAVRVVDELGNDVTPISLLSEDKRLKDYDKDTPTDLLSLGSQQKTGTYGATLSSFQGATAMGFAKSVSGLSGSLANVDEGAESDVSDDIGDARTVVTQQLHYTEMKTKGELTTRVRLTEKELNTPVTIMLEESETDWIFDLHPVILHNESELVPMVQERNAKYIELVKSKVGNDRFVERSMNTFDNPSIAKTVQTEKIVLRDNSMWATPWDMYDTYEEVKRQQEAGTIPEDKTVIDLERLGEDGERRDTQSPTATNSGGAAAATNGGGGGGNEQQTNLERTSSASSEIFGTQNSQISASSLSKSSKKNNELDILKSPELARTLQFMERALNLNTYQQKLANYRSLSTPKELEVDASMKDQRVSKATPLAPSAIQTPHLDMLWRYTSPHTKNRNISCMAWNKQNQDILAVGYGEYDFTHQKTGLVCCWSLKNVEHPERIYHLPNGVTAIDWSRSYCNLLAVGMFDGSIFIFDVRKTDETPVIDTVHSPGRHLGPVRQLQWVMRDASGMDEHAESLVSISADGRVTQWSIKKGFESSGGEQDFAADLMKLKRVSSPAQQVTKQRKPDALISRFAYGTSIAFNPQDVNIYLAGTEEGHIHRCSCAYNEQYLESFFGHTGPIYAIQWSPFLSDCFISCAADWTIKLWTVERETPILSFQSISKSINCLSWSPTSSVVFAHVHEGAVEVWNLQQSTLDPIITERSVNERSSISCVIFSPNSDSLIVGDSVGDITVYKMNYMPEPPKHQGAALEKVIASVLASQVTE